MAIDTQTPNPGTEDILKPTEEETKDNQRFNELKEKGVDISDEEKTEMTGLRDRHSERTQKRFDTLTARYKNAQAQLGERDQETQKLREELDEVKNQISTSREPDISIGQETIEVDSKKFFTDDALNARITSKQMTEAQAVKHQQDRIKAEAVDEAVGRIEGKRDQADMQARRTADQKKVLAEYPQFDNRHPDFNPNDPLFKKANEIFNRGFNNNPEGLSESIALAKESLGMTTKKPDASGDMSVAETSLGNQQKKDNEQEVTLKPEEEESGIRQWTRLINPATNRVYTDKEAIEKTKKAKQNLAGSRRIK